MRALLDFLHDTANKVYAAAFLFLLGLSVTFWLGWLGDSSALRATPPVNLLGGQRTLELQNRGPRPIEGVQLRVTLESAVEPVSAVAEGADQVPWPALRERLPLPGDERWTRPGGTGPWAGAHFWFGDLGRLAPPESAGHPFALEKGGSVRLTTSSPIRSLSVEGKEFYATLGELAWAERVRWGFPAALLLLLLLPLGQRLRAWLGRRRAATELGWFELGRFKQRWLLRTSALVAERLPGASRAQRALAQHRLLLRALQRSRERRRPEQIEQLLLETADELFGAPREGR